MRRLLALSLVLLPLTLVTRPAQAVVPACTDTYVGATGGVWSLASGWSTGVVPGPNDVVCLSKATTVDLKTNASQAFNVAAVRDTAALTVDPTGDLEVYADSSNPSTYVSLTVDGKAGFFPNSTVQTISGALTVGSQGYFQAQGALSAGSIADDGYTAFEQVTLTAPTLEVGSGGSLALGSGGIINTPATALTVDGGGTLLMGQDNDTVGSLVLRSGSTTSITEDNGDTASASLHTTGAMTLAGTLQIRGQGDFDHTTTGMFVAGTSVSGRFGYVTPSWSVTYSARQVDAVALPYEAEQVMVYADAASPGLTVRGPDGATVQTIAGGYDPQVSPSGRWLTYLSGGDGATGSPTSVRTVDFAALSATPTTVLSSPSHIAGIDIDPGDGRLWLDQSTVKTLDVDTGAHAAGVPSTTATQDAPAVSPDGTHFAAQDTDGIVVGNVDGSGIHVVSGTAPTAGSCAAAPQWSDDADLIYSLRTPCATSGGVVGMTIPIAGGTPTVLTSGSLTETDAEAFEPAADVSFQSSGYSGYAVAALTIGGHRGLWMIPTDPAGAPYAPRLITEVDATSVSRPVGGAGIGTTLPFTLRAGDPTSFVATIDDDNDTTLEVRLSGAAVPDVSQVTLTAQGPDTGGGQQPLTLTKQPDGSLVGDLDLASESYLDDVPMTITLAKGAPAGALSATFKELQSPFIGEDVRPRIASDSLDTIAVAATTTTVTAAPATVPSAPGVTLTAGDATVGYTVTAPASDGGAPVTAYVVTLTGPGAPAPFTLTAPGSGTIPGLTDGGSYSISVVAVNSAGPGAPGVAGPVVPRQRPAAPVITGISPSPRSLLVGFKQPVLPGAIAVTGWTTTCTQVHGTNSGSAIGAPPSTKVTGLVDNTDYTCVVVAHSSVGDVASAPAPGRPGRLPTVKITVLAKNKKVTAVRKGTKLTIKGTATVGDKPAAKRLILLTFRVDKTKTRKVIARTTSTSKGAFTFTVTLTKAGAFQAQLPLGPSLTFNKEVFVRRAV